MILKTFAIKDKALDSFGATFQQSTMEAGFRMFRDIVLFGDENNRYRRNPEDYALYFVGEYDDTTATLIDCATVLMSTATEVLNIGENHVT